MSADRPKQRSLKALIFLSAITVTTALSAESKNQLHTRFGYFRGAYSGVSSSSSTGTGSTASTSTNAPTITTSVSLINTFDFEYEIFSSMRSSYTIRTTIGYDFGIARMVYSYVGLGRNFYLWSDGQAIDSTEGASQISTLPKMRYFVGGDLGISRVVVGKVGTTAEIGSSLVDFGAHFGTIYQLNSSLGLEAHTGIGYGWGFSSVAVGAFIMKFFVGTSYFF